MVGAVRCGIAKALIVDHAHNFATITLSFFILISLPILWLKEMFLLAWSPAAGDFQESCHSLAAIQAALINASSSTGSGS